MIFDQEDRATISGHLSRKDAVLRVLSRAICDGRMPAGMRLNQDEIASQLNVSRMPVREALKDLEAQGLVTFYPYRGVEVSHLSADDIEELFAMRASLERLSLQRAVPNLTERDFIEMRQVLEHMDELLQSGEQIDRQWTPLNDRFHGIINRACGWPRLNEEIANLRANVGRYVIMYMSLQGSDEPQRQHWDLYEACKAGDIPRAQDIIESHVMDTAHLLIAALKKKEENSAIPLQEYSKGA
ncbi:GntR family transcriptional regulator [Telmatospirillum sp. J64-1]|uniref:GntR family transcriptional regulator n=1 Tax=Telmatospirillum sp. J64-1 TaxID=2502183 RepID=UPI00115DC27C|nr:GntR family transcriptional regulator [Telmatospirillum sp. J64-1]